MECMPTISARPTEPGSTAGRSVANLFAWKMGTPLPKVMGYCCDRLLPGLIIRQPNRHLCFPFRSIWLLVWIGEEGLQACTERVALLGFPGVPHQTLLRSPVQQRSIRLDADV